jgi:hypothetical protein
MKFSVPKRARKCSSVNAVKADRVAYQKCRDGNATSYACAVAEHNNAIARAKDKLKCAVVALNKLRRQHKTNARKAKKTIAKKTAKKTKKPKKTKTAKPKRAMLGAPRNDAERMQVEQYLKNM